MRSLARLLVVLGAVGIGWLLFGASPRDVVLVYDVAGVPGATALEVEIRRGGDVVRHARLTLGGRTQARHPVRLPEGTYELSWRLDAAAGAARGARELVVAGEETIVLPLGP